MPRITHTPTGAYPTPSPVHHLDLEAAASELLARLPGHGRQSQSLARESGTSLVLMAMEAGDQVAEHSARGVVTIQALHGKGVISAAGAQYPLQRGQVVMLQPEVRHSIAASERSVFLLTVTGGDE
jgi:quercetin dioxygenase-like cupin family protein